jgi:hypothetical protein
MAAGRRQPTDKSQVDTLNTEGTPLLLPDADVPELEFAGIKAQYAALKDAIGPRIGEVFRHGRFILGPEIEELEAALAGFVGVRHAVGVARTRWWRR